MNWPFMRPRQASELVTGAQTRIRMGLFGSGSPAFAAVDVDPNPHTGGVSNYHEGALFSPGTGNFVFESGFENPLQTVWGRGFIRNPNTFKVTQPPQLYSNPQLQQNGLGGLMAGQIIGQPLLLTNENGGT